jgi:hypothetical protein
MSWGMSEHVFKEMPRLNTLALIEFSLNFCNLCSALSQHLHPQPSQLELAVEIKNAFVDGMRLFLIPHPVSSAWWSLTDDRHYAPEASTKRQIAVAFPQLKLHPEAVAFELVRAIFLWFGVGPDRIPYSSAEGDLKFIDAAQIVLSRSS